MQATGHVGVLGGVIPRRLKGNFGEGNLCLALTADFFKFNVAMVDMHERQFIQAMAVRAGFQHIGQAHRVVDRRHRDAAIGRSGQHQGVIFDVMANLEDRRILQQIL